MESERCVNARRFMCDGPRGVCDTVDLALSLSEALARSLALFLSGRTGCGEQSARDMSRAKAVLLCDGM